MHEQLRLLVEKYFSDVCVAPECIDRFIRDVIDVCAKAGNGPHAVSENNDNEAFLSTVAHELRTPLTAILGFAKIVQGKLERLFCHSLDTNNAGVNKQITQVMENLAIIVTESERLGARINTIFKAQPGIADSLFATLAGVMTTAGNEDTQPAVQTNGDAAPNWRQKAATARKEILVIDDEVNIRRLLQLELEAAGYSVSLATDGAEAIARLKLSKPDLVILDVMMPGMNGYDVAAVLKGDPHTSDVPILILSVYEDKARGYNIGVDRFLGKPFDTDELLRTIAELLSYGVSRKRIMIADKEQSPLIASATLPEARGYSAASSRFDSKYNLTLGELKLASMNGDFFVANHAQSIKTLRFEKGVEHLCFVVQSGADDPAPSA